MNTKRERKDRRLDKTKKESEGGEHGQLMSFLELLTRFLELTLQPRTLKKLHHERKRKQRSEETVKW